MSLHNRAVFLDRDGTINRNVPYCSRPEDFELLPGAGLAVSILKKAGFKIIVITNQSGIARGYLTEDTLDLIHEEMCRILASHGGGVDAVYYCPHHPEDGCECRKPKPGMILKAAADHGIDLGQSYFVGDNITDMLAATSAGCKAVFIRGMQYGEIKVSPDFVCQNLEESARLILKESGFVGDLNDYQQNAI